MARSARWLDHLADRLCIDQKKKMIYEILAYREIQNRGYCLLPTAYCPLPTVYCLRTTVYCLRTTDKLTTNN
jgi:hypothetical protein